MNQLTITLLLLTCIIMAVVSPFAALSMLMVVLLVAAVSRAVLVLVKTAIDGGDA